MKEYDFIFGLGGSCKCSMALRIAGLQLLSFPLDWVYSPGLCLRGEMIRNRFDGWFDKECLTISETPKFSAYAYYKNHLGCVFNHDFLANSDFAVQYDGIKAKYDRRVKRFLEMLNGARKALMVWIDVPPIMGETLDNVLRFKGIMKEAYPDLDLDIVYLRINRNVKAAKCLECCKEGVRIVEFDFQDRHPQETGIVADERILAKWLKSNYSLNNDYRTEAEKAAWKQKVATHEWGRYRAKNLWQYLANKFSYKLYVHLRKRLEKKGVI